MFKSWLLFLYVIGHTCLGAESFGMGCELWRRICAQCRRWLHYNHTKDEKIKRHGWTCDQEQLQDWWVWKGHFYSAQSYFQEEEATLQIQDQEPHRYNGMKEIPGTTRNCLLKPCYLLSSGRITHHMFLFLFLLLCCFGWNLMLDRRCLRH